MRFRALGRRAALVALATLLATATGACKKKEVPAAPALPPAPARPAEVLLELQVPRPSESWPALQALLGSPVTFLPKAPELALGGWLALSPLVSSSLDLRAPLVAVALAGAEPALVIGVHLQSGPEFIAQLTTGNAPTYRLQREGGLALLTALKAPDASPLAVQGDALLIGPRAGLLRAGSYVARGLLRNATADGPITAWLPGESLRTVAVPALRALWQRRQGALEEAQRRAEQEHGRPADFADPGALLAGLGQGLEAAFSVLASAEKATAQLTLEAESLELLARLWPLPGGAAEQWAQSLPIGPTATLGALPARTVFGVLLRRSPDPATHDLAGGVATLLGVHAAAADDRALADALGALDSGRGNVQAFGVLDDLNLVWRGEVADPTLMRRGLKSTLAAFTKKPLVEPVTAFLGQPTLTQTTSRLENLELPADRALFRLTPKGPAKAPGARQFELLSLVESSRFLLVAASGAPPAFAEALSAERGPGSLAESEPASSLLARSPQAAFLVFADLGRFSASAGNGPVTRAPLTFTLGQRDRGPEFALRASQAALRVLLSRGLAL
jgi:hypothetical protein